MKKVVEKAFKKVTSLPEKESEDFAAFILAELESKQKWSELFEKSTSKLRTLADEALAEDKKGNTKGYLF